MELRVGEEDESKNKGSSDFTAPNRNLPMNRHGNLKTASSDQNLTDFLHHIRFSKSPAVVNYDIDECPETTQNIRYTPTFHFYREGERVDEMFGAGEERLLDRLWLHS
ncbi:Thioredoxin-like 3-3-like protein [Drosera capensis]